MNANAKFYAYMLALTDNTQLQWSAQDDGSAWGKPSRRPTHAYTLALDESGSPVLTKRELQAGEKIGQQNLKRLRQYHNPEAHQYKGVAFGMATGFALTLTSILLALLFAQMALDKEKQQDIENEAKKAIAICSASQAIARNDFDAAEHILDEAEPLFPDAKSSVFAANNGQDTKASQQNNEASSTRLKQNSSSPSPTSLYPVEQPQYRPGQMQSSNSAAATESSEREWIPDGQPNDQPVLEQATVLETTTAVGSAEPWMPPAAPQKMPNPVMELPDIRMKSEHDKPEITWQPPARMDNVKQPQPDPDTGKAPQSSNGEWKPQ